MIEIRLRALLFAGCAVAAACSDATGPGPFTASLNRYQSVRDDSVAIQRDSAEVQLPAGVQFLMAVKGSGMDTLVTTFGTGTSWIRWQRNFTTMVPGTYVDTFTLQRNDGGQAVLWLDSVVIRATVEPFIAVRRAWRPGERDSAIAAIVADSLWFFPGVGDFSAQAAVMLAPDSTTQIVPNPLYHPAAANFPNMVMNPTLSGMTLVGFDFFVVDSSVTPLDTTNSWLMFFWYNTTTNTYKGYTVVYSTSATIGPQQMDNTAWDASGGTAGGGGGEFNPTTGEYWETTAGTMQVTSNTARTGTASTIASGPYAGGVQRSGTMAGWQHNVKLSRLLPSVGPTQNWSLDFRSAPVPAARIVCMWYGPPPTLNVNQTCNP